MGSRREHWYSIFETPAPTTPHPCREITNTSGGIQTGVTQLLRPVQLPLEEQVGTHPWHPQKAPYSSQHWLIPSRKEASASLPYWPWGPSCYRLFSWTSSECTRIKEDPGGKSRVPTVGGGGGVCAGSLGRDFRWRSEMSPRATWISPGAKWGGASRSLISDEITDPCLIPEMRQSLHQAPLVIKIRH